MFKAVVLIKRKKGMSMKDFIEYYENNHAPLAISKVPNLRRYVRHFIRPYGNEVYATEAEAPYDVITEIWFDNEEEFHKGMSYLSEPETASLIAADEENLFDRSSIRFMTMEDHETPAELLGVN
ncbi:MAG: EthD domain-containing protein [Novosphingobium sp.]